MFQIENDVSAPYPGAKCSKHAPTGQESAKCKPPSFSWNAMWGRRCGWTCRVLSRVVRCGSRGLFEQSPEGVPLLTVIPGSPICSEGSGTVACTLGTLGSGSSTAVAIVVGVDPAASGTLTNTARTTAETPASSPACGRGPGWEWRGHHRRAAHCRHGGRARCHGARSCQALTAGGRRGLLRRRRARG